MKKLLLTMVALGVVAPVPGQEMGPPPIVEAAHNRVAAFLNLEADQIAAWDAVYRIHRDAEQPIEDEIEAVLAEIDALFGMEDPDPAEVGALAIRRNELGEALFELHRLYHDDFVALLDETQTRRLKLIARADDVQAVIPAFKLFELIPPH